jgi:1,4-alpha-glucan branching enzyme
MSVPTSAAEQVHGLRAGACRDPHALLGAHPLRPGRKTGVVVRAWQPGAVAVAVRTASTLVPLAPVAEGLFEGTLPRVRLPLRYRLVVTLGDGRVEEVVDPYRFLPTLGELDLHLFNEGRHLRLWEALGAQPRTVDGVAGTGFAVWAPTAQRVAVVGDFNGWDSERHPMRLLGASGVWELFLPGVGPGALYKFAIRTAAGETVVKTDPYARLMEQAPGHASIVQGAPAHAWGDAAWLARRAESDPLASPMLVYEVHLPSWQRGAAGEVLSYRALAPRLAAHVRRLGFTHVELMPVLEHPYGGSWGYQVGGYYAPTSRHGTPDDFRALVDTLHQAGIGVLLDWVPAHFPKDAWALRRFDGTACYEHQDPRLGDHPEWGTHIFNYARHEVRNFLVANALYWIEAFHLDGLRVDAVASMLYLDYGREPGQWLRNRLGGRENLDAVAFLRQLTQAVRSLHPGVVMVAEESTAWPGVTAPVEEGGLGFTFKWNMGWMHDTLAFFGVDPLFRRGVHDRLTFAMMYEYSERFCNPLSHDEVVHLKQSLLGKMPGDRWQRFANLRALLAYAVTRPGKTLLFMGTELAPEGEWNHDVSLDWGLLDDPAHRGVHDCLAALGALYRAHPCLWRRDHDPSGHAWIVVDDKAHSVVAYARHDGAAHLVVVANLTPVPRPGYRLGVPAPGAYATVLNTDGPAFGGSGYAVPASLAVEAVPQHGYAQSVVATLPPLSVLVLAPEGA